MMMKHYFYSSQNEGAIIALSDTSLQWHSVSSVRAWATQKSDILCFVVGNIILYSKMALEKLGNWQNWSFNHGP